MTRTTMGPRGRKIARTHRAMGYVPTHGALGVSDECEEKASTMLATHNQRVMDLMTQYWPPLQVEWPDVQKTLFGLVDMGKVVTDMIGVMRSQPERGSSTLTRLRQAELNIYSTINANEMLGDKAPMEGATYKSWVVNSMIAIGSGMRAVLEESCDESWYRTYARGYNEAFDRAWDAAASIGDGIKKVFDLVSTMWTVMKWGTVAYGAYWLYTKFPKKKS